MRSPDSDAQRAEGRPTCVCWGMFRKLLSRDPMLTNLLGAGEPDVEYAEEGGRGGEERDRKREREDSQTAHTHKKNNVCTRTYTNTVSRC